VIQDGSNVTMEYKLKLDEGELVDTSDGGEPFVYRHGAGEILPALEEELTGMAVGGEKGAQLTRAIRRATSGLCEFTRCAKTRSFWI